MVRGGVLKIGVNIDPFKLHAGQFGIIFGDFPPGVRFTGADGVILSQRLLVAAQVGNQLTGISGPENTGCTISAAFRKQCLFVIARTENEGGRTLGDQVKAIVGEGNQRPDDGPVFITGCAKRIFIVRLRNRVFLVCQKVLIPVRVKKLRRAFRHRMLLIGIDAV